MEKGKKCSIQAIADELGLTRVFLQLPGQLDKAPASPFGGKLEFFSNIASPKYPSSPLEQIHFECIQSKHEMNLVFM